MASARPFFCDVSSRDIQHFEQAVICRKYAFVFGHFSQLAVEPFDGVGGVNQLSDLFGILGIGR